MVKVSVRLDSGLFKQAAFRRSLIQVVTKCTSDLESDIKISIQQGNPVGRVYRRAAIERVVGARKAQSLGLKRGGFTKGGKQKFVFGFGFHRASAPGQPPAADSGNLALSMKAERAVSSGRGIHAMFVVNANYGTILEHGGGYMAPRPYIAPAMKRQEPKFRAAVDQLTARAAA